MDTVLLQSRSCRLKVTCALLAARTQLPEYTVLSVKTAMLLTLAKTVADLTALSVNFAVYCFEVIVIGHLSWQNSFVPKTLWSLFRSKVSQRDALLSLPHVEPEEARLPINSGCVSLYFASVITETGVDGL